MQVREQAYGQATAPTGVDRLGVWLSGVAIRRHAVFDNKRVADFGCGYHARFARQLLPRVRHMLLVDVSLADDLTRHPKVNAVAEPIESVLPDVESESVDIVLCISVLEHLDEPQEVVEHFRRILSPGGIVLINVPSWRGKRLLELAAFRSG